MTVLKVSACPTINATRCATRYTRNGDFIDFSVWKEEGRGDERDSGNQRYTSFPADRLLISRVYEGDSRVDVYYNI